MTLISSRTPSRSAIPATKKAGEVAQLRLPIIAFAVTILQQRHKPLRCLGSRVALQDAERGAPPAVNSRTGGCGARSEGDHLPLLDKMLPLLDKMRSSLAGQNAMRLRRP